MNIPWRSVVIGLVGTAIINLLASIQSWSLNRTLLTAALWLVGFAIARPKVDRAPSDRGRPGHALPGALGVLGGDASAANPVPNRELRQLVTADSVSDLLAEHETALGVLATNGHQPDLLEPDEVIR